MIVRACDLSFLSSEVRKRLDEVGSVIAPEPLRYQAKELDRYLQAKLTREWYRTYGKYPNGHLLFGEDELRRKQIPQLVRHPISGARHTYILSRNDRRV